MNASMNNPQESDGLPAVNSEAAEVPATGDHSEGLPAEGEGQVAAPTAAEGDEGADNAGAEDAAAEDVAMDDYDDSLTEEDLLDEYDSFEGEVNPIEEQADEEVEETNADLDHRWYILKVQSNREKSICEALKNGSGYKVWTSISTRSSSPPRTLPSFKNGKRRVVKRKLYPGYIVVHMTLNDDTWFIVRETPGIGDFTGAAGKPTEMMPEEVDRIVRAAHPEDEDAEQIKTAIPFKLGDRVRIKEGTFENFEGDVEGIDEANGRVTVMINIFGRSTPVELEHWQIESV